MCEDDDGGWLDTLHTGLDIIGTFDPSPVSDGLNAIIYGLEGDWKNAAISLAGMVPYVGDAGKVGRLGTKAVRSVRRGYKTAREAAEAAAGHGWTRIKGERWHGQPVYTDKRYKYSRDIDSHK